MTVTEKLDELSDTLNAFITAQKECNAAQQEYNALARKHEIDLRGNGRDGVLTTLVKLDGRLVPMEDTDKRRQKLVDGLAAAFALMAVIEVVRLIAINLP